MREQRRRRDAKQNSERNVHKKKRKKVSAFRFYFWNILLGLIIVGIVTVMVVSVFFTVRHVTVSGTTLYSDAEIEELVLHEEHSDNTIYAAVKNLIQPRKDIPFVDKVTVRITSPNSLSIIIREKRLIGYVPVVEGTYAYFDSQGTVIQVSDRLVEGVMAVVGAECLDASEGEALQMEEDRLEYLVELLKMLDKYELSPSAVIYTEQGGITMVCNELMISLGKQDDLEEKMRRLPYVLPSLEGKAGTLHLENWSSENTDIVFRE